MGAATQRENRYPTHLHTPKHQWLDGYDDPAQRLADLELFCSGGVGPAIHDAWIVLRDNEQLPQPAWLLQPTLEFVKKHLPREQTAYQKDMIAFYRWREI